MKRHSGISMLFTTILLGCTFLSSCSRESKKVEIQMQEVGGVYQIPCKVNGVPMNFIFDTGASNVCISLTEALYLYKNGHITNADIGETSYSQIADGSIVENMQLTLQSIDVGGIVINDVDAIVVSSLNAPLLLGQTAIQRLGIIELHGNYLTIYPYREISNHAGSSRKNGMLWTIQDWWNDGWHYVCNIEPKDRRYSDPEYKLYKYRDETQGNVKYQIWWRKEKRDVRLNPYFGINHPTSYFERQHYEDNTYLYKYMDSDGILYFNFPMENFDVEWSKRQAELKAIEAEQKAIEAKKWKFVRIIELYYIINGEHNTLSKEYGNLYWRESDSRFMVIPCGSDRIGCYYDSETKKNKMHEPRSPRMLLVEEDINDKYYEKYILRDDQHKYIDRWIPYINTYTHKAGEYSFDL